MPEPDPKDPPKGDPKGDPPKFDPITSQEDFDRALGARLERERSKFADYDDLKAKASKYDEAENKNKTEAQRLAEESATHKGRAETAETNALRFEVALEKGLTKSQAKRLVGATREELEKDADELLVDLGKNEGDGKPSPTRRPTEQLRPGSGGEPSTGSEETDPSKLAASVPRGF